MDQLPQELVDRITSYLPKDDLKSVLTLASKFRYAAERYSGSFSEFSIDERNAQKFVALYSGHRLSFLREINFRPRCAPYIYRESNGQRMPCRENPDELRQRDESFTRQIGFLFTTLRSVEEHAIKKYGQGRYRLSIYSPTRLVDSRVWCPHLNFVSWRVHLLQPSSLPQVASVRSLEICNKDDPDDTSQLLKCPNHPENPVTGDPDLVAHYPDCLFGHELKLDLRVIVDLATKLPNLEFLGFQGGGYEWCPNNEEEEPKKHYEHDWEGPRRDARHDFASAVTSCKTQLPGSLKRASMDFLKPLRRALDLHQGKALPDLVSPAKKDPFSTSLHIMANSLCKLQLRGMVDESLFWPNEDRASFGPNLEVLELMFHPARPDGKWYFQGPRGEGHDAVGFEITDGSYPPFETSKLDREMDRLWDKQSRGYNNVDSYQFRIAPDEKNLRPLLEGFAKAAARMPSLREALIWSPLSWLPSADSDDSNDFDDSVDSELDGMPEKPAWGIAYAQPGSSPGSMKSEELAERCQSRQLFWMVGRWRPDLELHSFFQHIGQEEHGEELKELWTEDFYRNSIVRRDGFFEKFMFHYDDPGKIPHSY